MSVQDNQASPRSNSHTSVSRTAQSKKIYTIASSLDEDFLGLQLGSLLRRAPETPSESLSRPQSRSSDVRIPKKSLETAYAPPAQGSSFTTHRRRSSSTKGSGRDTDAASTSSPKSPVVAIPSTRGVFGSFFSPPPPTPGTSMTLPSAASTRIGSAGVDYFTQTTRNFPTSPSASSVATSTSMSTSFGRKPSQKKNKESCARSTASQDLLTSITEDTMTHTRSSSSVARANSSSITADSGRTASSAETGITTPPKSQSEILSSGLDQETWIEPKNPSTPLEAALDNRKQAGEGEVSNDQTTWKRFKEGGVIEPPEAESLQTHLWEREGGTRIPASRYATFTSSRAPSSLSGNTAREKRLSGLVSLVPSGQDGRTFVFVDRSDSTPSLRRDSNGDSDDSGPRPQTPEETKPSLLQQRLDETWMATPTKRSNEQQKQQQTPCDSLETVPTN